MMLFISTSLLITNCKSVDVNSKKNVPSTASSEDFNTFYNRFHEDSAFQMSRIKFPIQGMYIDGNEEKKWDEKNWGLMKIKIYDVDKKQFKVYFKKTKKVFVQKVWIENSGFSSECRFKLTNKKWYLLYFLDQNL